MKKYLVFASDFYYPSGGWTDFIGAFDNRDDAVQKGKNSRRDFWHVVDLETLSIVEES